MANSNSEFKEVAEDIFSNAPKARESWNKSAQTRSVAAVLTVVRTEAGLTQKQVAERAGWDKAFVSRLESGVSGRPDTATITRYAEACGMEVGLVFGSLKSVGIGYIHTAMNLSSPGESRLFDHAAQQELILVVD